MNKYFASLAFALLIALSAFAQYKDVAATTKQIESYLDQMEKVGFSGSVLVDINGQKIISKGYGYSDVEKQLKNAPATIFNLNSITKQFTAAAILKLEMQGKISVADTISKYFENVPIDKQNITTICCAISRAWLATLVTIMIKLRSRILFIRYLRQNCLLSLAPVSLIQILATVYWL